MLQDLDNLVMIGTAIGVPAAVGMVALEGLIAKAVYSSGLEHDKLYGRRIVSLPELFRIRQHKLEAMTDTEYIALPSITNVILYPAYVAGRMIYQLTTSSGNTNGAASEYGNGQ